MARAMVTRLGYSDTLGLVAYGENQEEVFLGMSVSKQQNISESTAQKIDMEVRRLIDEGYETARRILTENKTVFTDVAESLLEYETLTGDEIKDIIAGKRPTRDRQTPPRPRAPAPSPRSATSPARDPKAAWNQTRFDPARLN